MTQSVEMNSAVDNAKWALESELARKNGILEDMEHKSEKLQASVKTLEAELNQLRASSQLELDCCRRTHDDVLAGKDAALKDMQMKMDRMQHLLHKQVGIRQTLYGTF